MLLLVSVKYILGQRDITTTDDEDYAHFIVCQIPSGQILATGTLNKRTSTIVHDYHGCV